MTEQEQIDALKAQVNCLSEVLEQLAKLGNGDKYGNSIGNTIAINALAKTPEQCLAEVKVQAIKEMVKNFNKDYSLGTSLLRKIENYTKELLEQAK